jgi:hypothetical protein
MSLHFSEKAPIQYPRTGEDEYIEFREALSTEDNIVGLVRYETTVEPQPVQNDKNPYYLHTAADDEAARASEEAWEALRGK